MKLQMCLWAFQTRRPSAAIFTDGQKREVKCDKERGEETLNNLKRNFKHFQSLYLNCFKCFRTFFELNIITSQQLGAATCDSVMESVNKSISDLQVWMWFRSGLCRPVNVLNTKLGTSFFVFKQERDTNCWHKAGRTLLSQSHCVLQL